LFSTIGSPPDKQDLAQLLASAFGVHAAVLRHGRVVLLDVGMISGIIARPFFAMVPSCRLICLRAINSSR
jgi:hypothetical protein